MTTVEFGTKAAADATREDYPDALCPDDDRRLKTVRFRSDAPDHVVEEARRRSDQSRADQEAGPGRPHRRRTRTHRLPEGPDVNPPRPECEGDHARRGRGRLDGLL